MKLKENSAELILSSADNIELIRVVLAKGASYRFKAKGFSMYPFIRNNDTITISPLTKETKLSLGRVVAFIHPLTRKLVVHRVIGRRGSCCLIKADNCLGSDGAVPQDDIMGYISKVERNSKRIILGLGNERYFIALLSRSLPVFPLLLLLWKYLRGNQVVNKNE
ncbi:MAG: S26 family signal peptidase [Candidatus Omnitrophica bacterium]|nr:S26 family signal peptidase [Candidatus Omnitrophota bacterium]